MKKRNMTLSVLTLVGMFMVMAISVHANSLSKELARARAATATYHDVANAEADGYTRDMCHEGEGCHWFNWGIYDDTFDPEHPEALIYRESPSGGYQLVAVEYIVPTGAEPTGCPADPIVAAPEGFTGDEDSDGWRHCTEGYTDWELTAWIWSHNPDGMFAMENPRFEHEEE